MVVIRYRTEQSTMMSGKNSLPHSERVDDFAKNIEGRRKAEGKGDQAEGKIQNAVGSLNDGAKHVSKKD
jgi:hypothetical protein